MLLVSSLKMTESGGFETGNPANRKHSGTVLQRLFLFLHCMTSINVQAESSVSSILASSWFRPTGCFLYQLPFVGHGIWLLSSVPGCSPGLQKSWKASGTFASGLYPTLRPDQLAEASLSGLPIWPRGCLSQIPF